MNLHRLLTFIPIIACSSSIACTTLQAQQCSGTALTGTVRDSTSALVANAAVSLDGSAPRSTDRRGSFSFDCVTPGHHILKITADTFTPAQLKINITSAPPAAVLITLRPQRVETTVDATEASGVAVDSQDAAGAKTLDRNDLAKLADDPDDFQRELQTLAAAAGGTPGQAIITVDGFQNGSRLPPKNSIAFIRLNPDLFSSEYERPPYQGGRIEVYTKPGADKLHGSVFFNTSDAFMNARDPFATSRASIGKQRFGFDLSGPIVRKKADFNLNLERRDIDEFATVNAITLNSSGDQQSVIANIPTPQRLWIGSANVSWQLNRKNLFTTSYTANVNTLGNLGTGGTSLAESGFNSTQSEHTIRATNITTVSPRMVHEARASLSWKTVTDSPNSSAAQLFVAGAFTGGGASAQATHTRELATEVDEDVLYTRGKHNLKAGIQLLNLSENQHLPQGFNGSYVFGGGLAPVLDANNQPVVNTCTQPIPGTCIAISGLEQYRRAQLNLAGGAPTTYSITIGSPTVNFNEFRTAFFVQEQWKLKPRLQIAMGLRYAIQTAPASYANFAPRVGVSWSPDKKQTWVLRARSGIFTSTTDIGAVSESFRLNGSQQVSSTVYSPASFANPLADSTPITSTKLFAPSIAQVPSLQSHLGVEHEFKHHWHAQSNLYLVHAWDVLRSRNINSPLLASASASAIVSPYAPRPIAADTNILQYQQTGHLGGNVLFMGIDQHSYSRYQIFVGYLRMDLRGNADGATTTPQSAYTDAGETARPSWQQTHRIFALGSVTLPRKVTLTGNLDSASGTPYNLVTGFDNNGDGDFNDRPTYASPGTTSAVSTQYGSLTSTGGTGVLPRNAATLPWTVHLDMNLSRTFAIDSKSADHPQTLAVNLRSANILNHTNVTAVGNTLGSPLFGVPYAAEASRRIELGLRYSF